MNLIKQLIQEMLFAVVFLSAVLAGCGIEVQAANSEWKWTEEGIVYQVREDDSGENYVVIIGYSNHPSNEFIVPSEMDGVPVKEILPDALFVTGAENLIRIVLPEGIETLYEDMFRYCYSLEDVTLGGVKKFENKFGLETEINFSLFSSTKLKRLTLGDACSFSVKYMGDRNFNIMPEEIWDSLEYLYIGNQMPEVSEQIFWGKSLKEIETGVGNLYYKSIEGMVFDRSGEILISVPTDYKRDTLFIPYGTKRISKSGGFLGCKNIKTIYIPQTVAQFSSLKDSANKDRMLYVVQGSAGEAYAKEQEAKYQYYGVYLNKTELRLKPGESEMLQTVNETENSLSWRSSAPEIIQVDQSGTITAQKEGQAVVFVTDGKEFTVKCKVDVSANLVKPDQQNQDSGFSKPKPENSSSWLIEADKTINQEDCRVGQKITDPKTYYIYKITGVTASNRTVTYMGSKKQNIKSITVPKAVFISGVLYKVTEIAPDACKGMKKLSVVTISENITKIGKRAFRGCTRLKKIILKSRKLKAVGKNAFKGIHKKCRIKVPTSKLSVYKKIFLKKGQKSSVKII